MTWGGGDAHFDPLDRDERDADRRRPSTTIGVCPSPRPRKSFDPRPVVADPFCMPDLCAVLTSG
ncbi:hypothetical protein [Sphingomonas sp.]|uniref:hypothetical protein n=1 Tax=Sphingomonas sp. TaxID=28214 RepID=UPI0035AFBF7D